MTWCKERRRARAGCARRSCTSRFSRKSFSSAAAHSRHLVLLLENQRSLHLRILHVRPRLILLCCCGRYRHALLALALDGSSRSHNLGLPIADFHDAQQASVERAIDESVLTIGDERGEEFGCTRRWPGDRARGGELESAIVKSVHEQSRQGVVCQDDDMWASILSMKETVRLDYLTFHGSAYLTGLTTHSSPTTIPHTSVLPTSINPSGLASHTSMTFPLATTRDGARELGLKSGTDTEWVTAVESRAWIEERGSKRCVRRRRCQ